MNENDLEILEGIIPLIGKNIETIYPSVLINKTVSVLNVESARVCFRNYTVDKVYCMDASTGIFTICFNLQDCINFYNEISRKKRGYK